ncbi:hypothetical protein J132_05794 [Termitomyces sp. J132]|nr:hypothetical protein H2248_000697 [Termitomyces sp. 'cryptogamus']KNZ71837.1 hypothetical protein J132_05794 [Termitomyces sp. J132]
MIEPPPPPIYSQMDPDEGSTVQAEPIVGDGPQILIIPSGDSVNFQKGFLGAEGEHAAIEGELQIKTAGPHRWAKVTISLRTVERAEEHEIELATSENVLYTRAPGTVTPFPTSFPFAMPLQTDAPQSIRTSNSSLSYLLTATLHPLDPLSTPLSKTLTVHTRRYISHSHVVPVHPETYILEDPTRVEVQIPRITFVAGETIPVYVTVPPPAMQLVVDQGLRLRNVRIELVRIVKVKKGDAEELVDEVIQSCLQESYQSQTDGPSMTPDEGLPQTLFSKASMSLTPATSHKTIIVRSGASCRFHSSRPVKLRFLLNHPLSTGSPASSLNNLSNGDYGGQYDSDEECPSITQLTILHSITFCLFVYVSFVDITTRSERISTLSIPISILAPPAPLPQVSPEFDAAYSKKHDRPPLRTVRHDDGDHHIPHYSEGEAGPSILPNSAPPPFEERDAPPPFSSDDSGGSSSSRLPTFLESEEEIIIPSDQLQVDRPPSSPTIIGEGFEFGFSSFDQFDGHTEPLQRSMTPPPTLEMATRDTDLTDLADMGREPQMAIEALGLALDRHEESVAGERPPPPPAMDDPSDPPPTIDSDFRSPERTPPSHPVSTQLPTFTSDEPRVPVSLPEREPPQIHGYAPPPYLVPVLGNPSEQENVMRPPPYMD